MTNFKLINQIFEYFVFAHPLAREGQPPCLNWARGWKQAQIVQKTFCCTGANVGLGIMRLFHNSYYFSATILHLAFISHNNSELSAKALFLCIIYVILRSLFLWRVTLLPTFLCSEETANTIADNFSHYHFTHKLLCTL